MTTEAIEKTDLEKRVEELERQVRSLMVRNEASSGGKDWQSAAGAFVNDPLFAEAMRLGRRYRERDRLRTGRAASRRRADP